MYKNAYIPVVKLFMLMLSFAITAQINAANIDNIRFPKNGWDGHLVNIMSNGPVYLKKPPEFDLPPPPDNNSQKTIQELALLKTYYSETRTPE
jgi:hypothetical protein